METDFSATESESSQQRSLISRSSAAITPSQHTRGSQAEHSQATDSTSHSPMTTYLDSGRSQEPFTSLDAASVVISPPPDAAVPRASPLSSNSTPRRMKRPRLAASPSASASSAFDNTGDGTHGQAGPSRSRRTPQHIELTPNPPSRSRSEEAIALASVSPMTIHQEPIIISSSDESDDDDVMWEQPAVSIARSPSRGAQPSLSSSTARRRRRPAADSSSPSIQSAPGINEESQGPDSSSNDIIVDRVIRRAPRQSDGPIFVSSSSRLPLPSNASHSPPIPRVASAERSASIKLQSSLHASPPRSKPPPLANPLLSKYTCPICLSTPWPHVVVTPCGHMFCSACLFEALQVPIKQKEMAIRSQMAAFAALGRAGGLVNAEIGRGGGAHPPPPFEAGPAGSAGARTAAAAAPTTTIRTGTGGIETVTLPPETAESPPITSNDGPSNATGPSPPDPPATKIDPLVGPCPVCRTIIPGGFISGQLPATKRPVIGLQLKVGKPVDEPRRDLEVNVRGLAFKRKNM